MHSGEGCVYVCIVEGRGGALQNGVHHGRMCHALWEGVCTVCCYGHLDGKEEGRMCLVDCVVCTVASCLAYDSFDRLCSVGTVASCLAYDSFDRLCSVYSGILSGL